MQFYGFHDYISSRYLNNILNHKVASGYKAEFIFYNMDDVKIITLLNKNDRAKEI